MSFRLGTLFYVFALSAAALATFGPVWGTLAAGTVLALLAWIICGQKPRLTFANLVIAIAVLGMLVALLMPAVQSARGAAQRSQCANNLKQIAAGVAQL